MSAQADTQVIEVPIMTLPANAIQNHMVLAQEEQRFPNSRVNTRTTPFQSDGAVEHRLNRSISFSAGTHCAVNCAVNLLYFGRLQQRNAFYADTSIS